MIPYEEEKGSIFSDEGTDAIRNPDMHLFIEILQSLADHQWDYDLGDEYTLQRHAAVENGRLRVGAQHYEVVVMSGDMKNMLKSTASLLSRLMKSGGCVIACGNPGSYIDGLRDAAAYDALRSMWTAVESIEVLNTHLQTLLPPRIASSVAGLLHAGKNAIAIRVCGSLKNLLGPHFMKKPIRGSAWPAMWKDAPAFRQPGPDSYDLLAFGLTENPRLTIG